MSSPFAKREQPMPGFVKAALAKAKLLDAYRARPAYQRTDYLVAIHRAIGPAAKQAKLAQMIEELGKGDVYMGEPWAPPPPVK